jgi:hypothetical protein
VRISICHCLACKRRTGSAFGVQARFPDDQIKVEGKATEYTSIADSGNHVVHHFCPTCGSTVYWQLEALPGFTSVAVGAFADPTFPPPTISVYDERRHPWAVMPGLKLDTFE